MVRDVLHRGRPDPHGRGRRDRDRLLGHRRQGPVGRPVHDAARAAGCATGCASTPTAGTASTGPPGGPRHGARATSGRLLGTRFDPFGAAWRVQDRVDEDRSIDIVAAVREAVGPAVDLMIEGHERFSVSTALRIADRLAAVPAGLVRGTSPPPGTGAMVEVAQRSPVPVATGESFTSLGPVRRPARPRRRPHPPAGAVVPGWAVAARQLATMADAHYAVVAPHNAQARSAAPSRRSSARASRTSTSRNRPTSSMRLDARDRRPSAFPARRSVEVGAHRPGLDRLDWDRLCAHPYKRGPPAAPVLGWERRSTPAQQWRSATGRRPGRWAWSAVPRGRAMPPRCSRSARSHGVRRGCSWPTSAAVRAPHRRSRANAAVGRRGSGGGSAFIGRVGADGLEPRFAARLRGEESTSAVSGSRTGRADGAHPRERRVARTLGSPYYPGRFSRFGGWSRRRRRSRARPRGARWLHLTGITPALSPTAAAAVRRDPSTWPVRPACASAST